jgi:hypothetical protein
VKDSPGTLCGDALFAVGAPGTAGFVKLVPTGVSLRLPTVPPRSTGEPAAFDAAPTATATPPLCSCTAFRCGRVKVTFSGIGPLGSHGCSFTASATFEVPRSITPSRVDIGHGQWDWMNDPEIHSTTWEWDMAGLSSQRRYSRFEGLHAMLDQPAVAVGDVGKIAPRSHCCRREA